MRIHTAMIIDVVIEFLDNVKSMLIWCKSRKRNELLDECYKIAEADCLLSLKFRSWRILHYATKLLFCFCQEFHEFSRMKNS